MINPHRVSAQSTFVAFVDEFYSVRLGPRVGLGSGPSFWLCLGSSVCIFVLV